MHFRKIRANDDKKKAWDFLKKKRIPKSFIRPFTEMYEEADQVNFKKFSSRPMAVATPKVKNRGKNVSVHVIKDSCSTNE